MLHRVEFLEPLLLECSPNIEETIACLAELLRAEVNHTRDPIRIAEDAILVGPHGQFKFERTSSTFKIEQSISASTVNDLAWGLTIDAEDRHPVLLRYWKPQPELEGLAALVREHYLRPGTLVLVPRRSNIVVLAYPHSPEVKIRNLVVKDDHAPQDQPNESYCHFSPIQPHRRSISNIRDRFFQLSEPLIEAMPKEISATLNSTTPWVQIGPIMAPNLLTRVLEELGEAPWQRRFGPGYTQDALDFIAWTELCAQDTSSAKLARQLRSKKFARHIRSVTGIECEALLEISAYRFTQGDAVHRHSDSTAHGEMTLRANLILAAPDATSDDFVFYAHHEAKEPVVSFRGKPNTAICFLIGDQTPHEVTALTDGDSQQRINLVMTFGPSNFPNSRDYSLE